MDRQISLDLRDRILWFDGESSMSPDRMAELILSGKSIDGIHPTEVDKSVKKFNLYAESNLSLKNEIKTLDVGYCIPEEYLQINLKQYFLKKLRDVILRDDIIDREEIEARIERVQTEVSLFKQYKIEDLIRTVIYIVDTFEDNDIVWGTGRGSSCACYCLYLVGLHEVDSVFYGLELNEFFR